MPRLYCEEHGREYEADAGARQEEYRREGESVLIVRGRLRTGPWLCDRCNATLDSGSAAWLASFLPAWITGQTEAYEFEYERAYFAMNEATVAVYGAAWPAITLTPAGKVAHRPARRDDARRGNPSAPGSVRRGAGGWRFRPLPPCPLIARITPHFLAPQAMITDDRPDRPCSYCVMESE